MPTRRKSASAEPVQSGPQKIWRLKLKGHFESKAEQLCASSEPVKREQEANGDDDQLSAQGYIPHTELYGGLWSNVCLLQLYDSTQLTLHRSTRASRDLRETS
jgi:hypothetical protein